MANFVIDPSKSSVRLRTFAEGFFSRLAHDLELVCRDLTGMATRDGDKSSASMDVPIRRIEVIGALKGGRVDASALSSSDREDCLAKMHKDVFHLRGDAAAVVHVEISLEGTAARVRVTPPERPTVERSVKIRLEAVGEGTSRVSGSFELSLHAIGSDPVKGPMNAFRVKDAVEVLFDVTFIATAT